MDLITKRNEYPRPAENAEKGTSDAGRNTKLTGVDDFRMAANSLKKFEQTRGFARNDIGRMLVRF